MYINREWDNILKAEYEKDYFKQLNLFIEEEYNNNIIYPNKDNIYNALKLISFDDIKVVILGQDPYHREKEAHGLAFSVQEGIKLPPSLVNIFKELDSDLGIKRNKGNLEDWAKEGVLLLNTVLTVRKDNPNSHKNKGWEKFTDSVIKVLNDKDDSIVFILWGNNAKNKKIFINNPKHLIIESTHPSPFSCHSGFFGSKPFSKTNDFLVKNSKKTINW